MIDLRQVEEFRRRWPQQARYAVALSLTLTARAVAEDVRRALPQHFTIRNRWIPGSIRSVSADYRTGRPAAVGTISPLLVPHVYGGRRPTPGAVPSVGPGMPRPTKQSATGPSRWPASMLRKKGMFFSDLMRGSPGIFRRSKNGIRRVYTFPGRVTIKPDWPVFEEVKNAAPQHWPEAWRQAAQRAIATAR